MQTSAWLILLFPLIGTIVIGLGFRLWPARVVGAIGTLAIAAAFGAAIATFIALQGRGEDERQVVFVAWDYANTAGVERPDLDPRRPAQRVHGARRHRRVDAHPPLLGRLPGRRSRLRPLLAYLNFFVFSMLVLVMAGNFLLLIIGWAFVGAASYLLISFWYRRTTATAAGIKAFVINVLGDAGLVLGTFFIFRHSHTLDFLGTFDSASKDFAATPAR
jgi:NADH-quinone oxidoreductase subunit L